jgi:hypothetical protein
VRQVTRQIKRHFGASATQVAIRSQRPWYWQPIIGLGLILFGYLLAYWYLAGGEFTSLHQSVQLVREENLRLQARVVHGERQLQVERVAQENLAKELARLQDEDMRLKEDVAFYQNILKENTATGASEVKMHSFKVSKGAKQGQYDYHILILQSGRHDKIVEGNIKLVLTGIQDGKSVTIPLELDQPSTQALKINFKYYQRVDGTFSISNGFAGQAIEASFIEIGANRPKITQKVDFPG